MFGAGLHQAVEGAEAGQFGGFEGGEAFMAQQGEAGDGAVAGAGDHFHHVDHPVLAQEAQVLAVVRVAAVGLAGAQRHHGQADGLAGLRLQRVEVAVVVEVVGVHARLHVQQVEVVGLHLVVDAVEGGDGRGDEVGEGVQAVPGETGGVAGGGHGGFLALGGRSRARAAGLPRGAGRVVQATA